MKSPIWKKPQQSVTMLIQGRDIDLMQGRGIDLIQG
jgi:hypothetical protein